MSLTDRIRLAFKAPQLVADLERANQRIETQSRTIASVRKSRDSARTFAEAAKRQGLIPEGAWTRYVNCMTDSESEGDIQRDIEAAEAMRARLNGADSALAKVRP